MNSVYNKVRRHKMRRARDEAKRRARRLGLDTVPYQDRLKTENWDHRPNKTTTYYEED